MLSALLLVVALPGRTWIVAPSGGDFTRIQDALDVAAAGDVVEVYDRPGGYHEVLVFRRGGDPVQGPLVLRAGPGQRPLVTGGGTTSSDLLRIHDVSHVVVEGFEFTGLQTLDAAAIRITGACEDVVLRGNRIHALRGANAGGIWALGTSPTAPIRRLVIEGNEIHDCDVAPSEALVVSGHVDGFLVADNHVHDVNNIGIDVIGGESWVDPVHVPRHGVVRGNRVERANSVYGGGFAAGLYVDGARDLLLEGNVVTECDLGIEVGAENAGFDVSGVVVRSNLLYGNLKAGLVFGGYDRAVGRVRDCEFAFNTLWRNDTTGQFLGEIWIQWAEDCSVHDNVCVTTDQAVALYSERGNVGNVLDGNLWWSPAGADGTEWVWRGVSFPGFAAFRAGTGQEAHGAFADPLLASPASGDFTPTAGSPALDAGSPAEAAGLDLLGWPRVLDGDLDGIALPDRGAVERHLVTLEVTGAPVPGGPLTVTLDGPAGWSGWLAVGLPGAARLPGLGLAALDLGRPHRASFLGALPLNTAWTLPGAVPPGTVVVLQGAGLSAGLGSLSNPTTMVVE